VLAVCDAAARFAARVRAGDGPAFLECVSARFATHSSATRETRPAEELAADRARCPIRRLAEHLAAGGLLTPDERKRMDAEAAAVAQDALRFADAAPYPDPAELLRDVG